MGQIFQLLRTAWQYRELLLMLLPLVKQVIEAVKDDDDDDDQKHAPAPAKEMIDAIKQYKRAKK